MESSPSSGIIIEHGYHRDLVRITSTALSEKIYQQRATQSALRSGGTLPARRVRIQRTILIAYIDSDPIHLGGSRIALQYRKRRKRVVLPCKPDQYAMVMGAVRRGVRARWLVDSELSASCQHWIARVGTDRRVICEARETVARNVQLLRNPSW